MAEKNPIEEVSDVLSKTPAETTPTTTKAPIATDAPEVPAQVTPPTSSLDLGKHDHFAIRDFSARFEHQVLSFVKDELIDSRVGHALRAQGAPVRVATKKSEEIKAGA